MQFPATWICLFGTVLAAQAFSVYRKPKLSVNSALRQWLWLNHAVYMSVVALVLLICYGMLPMPSANSKSGTVGWWALLWFPSLALIVMHAEVHRQNALQSSAGIPGIWASRAYCNRWQTAGGCAPGPAVSASSRTQCTETTSAACRTAMFTRLDQP